MDRHGFPHIVDLGVAEVEAGLAAGTMILVDVREPNELEAGMIAGSIAMPLSRFDPGALPGGEGGRTVSACAAGVRSRIAIEAAQAAGLAVDAHLAPGLRGWIAAGRPVGPGPSRP